MDKSAHAHSGGSRIGSTIDCLRHYLKQLPSNTQGSEEARQPIADFTGVSSRTIRSWYVSNEPAGLPLIKVRYFLESKGYRIFELEDLLEPFRVLGNLIARNIVDAEAVSKELGYARVSKLYPVLHGAQGISGDRFQKIQEICSRYPEEKRIAVAPIAPVSLTSSRPAATAVHSEVSSDVNLEDDVLNLLRGLNALSALLEPRLQRMLSDDVTSAERQAFREKAGRQLVFDLSNRFYALQQSLNAVCSEKAREINSSNQRQR